MVVVLVREEDLAHAEQAIVSAGGTVLGSGFEPDLAAAMERLRASGA
jgi:hypothetical protein